MYSYVLVLFVTLSGVQFSNAAFRMLADQPIRYPGPTKEVILDRYNRVNDYNDDDVPEECKEQTYCTIKPKGYNHDKYKSMFNGLTFVPQPSPALGEGELGDEGNRQGDPSEKDDCDSTVTFEPLYKVKSTKEEWRTVIQSPDSNFVQKVRLETCKNPGGKCFNVFPSMPNFVTSCKQKYNIWELLVEGENGPETIKADLPVCCSCVYKAPDVGGRFGFV